MGELLDGQTYSTTSDGIRKYWLVDELWENAKELPVEYMPVEALVGQLNGTCWTDGDEDVTPQWVLGHTRRILKADLNYPILINSENMILDGIHRLCKAVIEGKVEVAVQRIDPLPTPTFSTSVDDAPILM